MKKKPLCFICALLCLIGVCFCAPFALAAEPAFTVTPFEAAETAVTLWENPADAAYYLFLPSGCAAKKMKTSFTAASAALDGVPLENGAAVSFKPGAHTLQLGQTQKKLYVLVSSGLPAIFIQTRSGSMENLLADKENKEPGTITVVENGKVAMAPTALKSIKGRGNSTWKLPKKPFNIKFDKKTSLLGMPAAKKWSLLANYKDDTATKTPVGLALGRMMGINYTSEAKNADIWFNGEYYGNYTVCESVEVGENRVEITDLAKLNEKANPDLDLEALPLVGSGTNGARVGGRVNGGRNWVDIPNNPANVTGGYLLELEYASRFLEEPGGFVTPRGQCVVLKAPEYPSRAEVDYIADYYAQAEEAVFSATGYNSQGKHYTEYFDMPSMVRTYVFTEFIKDYDASSSSFYLYKDANSGKFVAAPVWDFDTALCIDMVRKTADCKDPKGWLASAYAYPSTNVETLLTGFFRQETARDAICAYWPQGVLGIRPETVLSMFEEQYALNLDSVKMNLLRWKENAVFTQAAALLADADDTFDGICSFAATRLRLMDSIFRGTPAMLYYNSNGGGKGVVFNREMATVGGKVTVLSNAPASDALFTPPKGLEFKSWNTKADGTGISYSPGDQITLNEKTTTLYAVWGAPHTVHTYKNVVTKATLTKDGKLTPTCTVCGATGTATVIARASKVSIGKTKFVYNGKVQKPALTVNNSAGKAIDSEYYTVKWSNASAKAVGTYTVTVTFKGNYSGTKSLTYTIVPKAVTGVKKAASTTKSVKLSWTKATGAKYYSVFGSADGKTFKRIAVVSANTYNVTKVNGKALAAGKTYYFKVRALDSTKKLVGAFSAVLKTGTRTAAPKLTALTSAKSKTAVVTWGKVTGAKSYAVYKSADNKTWTKAGTTNGTSFTLSGLAGGKRIYVKVLAVNAYKANSAYSAAKYVTVKK